MDFLHFVCCLSEENRKVIYQVLIDERQLSDVEWESILKNLLEYRQISEFESKRDLLLRYLTDNEKIYFEEIINKDNRLRESKKIHSFEELCFVNEDIVRNVLHSFTINEIAIACLGTSPSNRALIVSIYDDLELEIEIANHTAVPIAQIEKLHNNIIERINGIITP